MLHSFIHSFNLNFQIHNQINLVIESWKQQTQFKPDKFIKQKIRIVLKKYSEQSLLMT